MLCLGNFSMEGNMRKICLSFSLAFLLIALIAPVENRSALAAENDQDAVVRNTVNGYAEAWNRHDMDALGALFASNGDFVNVTGDWWKGRQQIQANIAFLHATVPAGEASVTLPANTYGALKAVTYRFDRVDVRFIDTDVAVAHVTWTQFGDPRFSDPRHGILSFTVVRQNGHWFLDAGHNTTLAVPPPVKKSD
jgi:uncharacterized protein (TIGR02246 family)